MINCMYMHLELLYSKNKTKNKNNRVTDNQSTCLQNLLLTHLVYVIKVSRIIKSYYVMHLVLEIARAYFIQLFIYTDMQGSVSKNRQKTASSTIKYNVTYLQKVNKTNVQIFKSMSNSVTANKSNERLNRCKITRSEDQNTTLKKAVKLHLLVRLLSLFVS